MAKRRRPDSSREAVRCFHCDGELVGDELRCPHCKRLFREGKAWAAAIAVIAAAVVVLAYFAIFGFQAPSGSGNGSQPTHAVALMVPTTTHQAEAGRATDFALHVTNWGNVVDTVTITSDLPSADWTATARSSTLTLNPGGAKEVSILTVDVPFTSAQGTYPLTVTAISKGDPTKTASRTLSIIVGDLGSRTVVLDNKVRVDYTLWLTDGTEQDSSIPRGTPLKVYVGPDPPADAGDYMGTIQGFWEGILGMKLGETNVVRVPPEKAYDAGELAGQTLIFEIRLVGIDG